MEWNVEVLRDGGIQEGRDKLRGVTCDFWPVHWKRPSGLPSTSHPMIVELLRRGYKR